MPPRRSNPFFDVLRAQRSVYSPKEILTLFDKVSEKRVLDLASRLADYIRVNLPAAIDRREGLADYRANPYVLLTSASVMSLENPKTFAEFLFNNKLYMGLETSFGKNVEATFVSRYPLNAKTKEAWIEPPEKSAEFATYADLTREERASARVSSVWREIDKTCVVGSRRYMVSIKSGPNTINDTQVQGMVAAIRDNYAAWAASTQARYPDLKGLDIAVGLTYGTDCTTNNKENQILVKLIDLGFTELDRGKYPGVLVDKTGYTRVYRRIGRDFWSMIGDPEDPSAAEFVFLEILLALLRALSGQDIASDLESRINARVHALSNALSNMTFPRHSLPSWVGKDFSESELFWFATALSAFYDSGI